MEMITIPRKKYENMQHRLKELEKVDFNLISQFTHSLDDLKHGRFKKLA